MSKNQREHAPPPPPAPEAGQPSPYSSDADPDLIEIEIEIDPRAATIEAGAIAVFAVYAGQFRSALETDEQANSTRTAERLAKLSVKLATVLAAEINAAVGQ